jgi:hypothetical protein
MNPAVFGQTGQTDGPVENALGGTRGYWPVGVIRRREEPVFWTVKPPILPQHRKQFRGEHHLAVFLSFALCNPNLLPGADNVGYFQTTDFTDAQTGGVGGQQQGAMFGVELRRIQDALDLIRAINVWTGEHSANAKSGRQGAFVSILFSGSVVVWNAALKFVGGLDPSVIWLFGLVALLNLVYAREHLNTAPCTQELTLLASLTIGQAASLWASWRFRKFRTPESPFGVVIVAVVLILLAVVFFHAVAGREVFYYRGQLRWSGLLGNPNIFGLLMGFGLVIVIGDVLILRMLNPSPDMTSNE